MPAVWERMAPWLPRTRVIVVLARAMRPSARSCWAVVFWVILFGGVSGHAAWADAARKQCVKACKTDRVACLTLAGGRKKALAGECTGAGKTRKQCLGAATRVFKVARKSCATLLADCRACCKAGGQGPTCPVGHPFSFTPPPPLDPAVLGLPVAKSGRPLVLAVPGAQLELDTARRDAFTALGHCTRWITACAVSQHPLDDCARSVPLCATARPWEEQDECCAPSCFERYQQARRAGMEAVEAFRQTYYGPDSCMPGVADVLRAGRP